MSTVHEYCRARIPTFDRLDRLIRQGKRLSVIACALQHHRGNSQIEG